MKHIPKIIAIILAVILISLVYVLFFSSATVSTVWKDSETSETIGEFGQTLTAKYMDGSVEEVVINNNYFLYHIMIRRLNLFNIHLKVGLILVQLM